MRKGGVTGKVASVLRVGRKSMKVLGGKSRREDE
jgi:hypothetical protein